MSVATFIKKIKKIVISKNKEMQLIMQHFLAFSFRSWGGEIQQRLAFRKREV